MKISIKHKLVPNRIPIALAAILCLTSAPARAAGTSSSHEATPAPSPNKASPSIANHLQLDPRRQGELDRLYDAHASRRDQHEATIATRQIELRRAHEPATFDEGKANQLLRAIASARKTVVDDLLSTRDKAIAVLSPVQASQLDALANDSRVRIRHDRYFYLLLLPAEHLWQAPLNPHIDADSTMQRPSTPQPTRKETQSRREKQRHDNGGRRGNGHYGVYGGYGYGGPNYGVQGSYGEGPIGVHAGIGRGGPSVGISIGRVFGGWHR